MSAVRTTAESTHRKLIGEVQDYYIQWTAEIAPARVTAASGTGAWSLNGETGVTFTLYPHAGMSASAVSLTHIWTAYNSASGAGLTATGSASALVSLIGQWRATGGSASDREFTWSAVLNTSSGRSLYERFGFSITT